MTDRVCSVGDCGRRHFGKGFCQMHYQRWRAHGDPISGAAVRNPDECTVGECQKQAHARGMCPMHYQRLRLTGTTELLPRAPIQRPRRVGVEPCEIEGCGKPIQARGWCSAHWSRWKRHGSPTAQLRGEVVGGARRCPDCRMIVPLEDWYVRPSGRAEKCRSCFAEWNRDRGHRRRAVVSGDRFTRADVAQRDGWGCALCGDLIDRDLAHPHPLSPTLDHIIPLARSGEHAFENAQLAHRICNMRKWANVVETAS